LAHDIGHEGYDNAFLINTCHEVAVRYNDGSPLENMHCSKLFDIMNKPDKQIFASLEQAQYREVRKVCIEAILHTDQQKHKSMVKHLEMVYDMNRDLFDTHIGSADEEEPHPPVEVLDFFFSGEDKRALPQVVFLHFCDLSMPMKSWQQCKIWGDAMLQEMFMQGDQEADLGLPVPPMHNRHEMSKELAQIGIIEYIVAPLTQIVTKMWPGLQICEDSLKDNLAEWIEAWRHTEPPPDKEEIARMEKRLSQFRATQHTRDTRMQSRLQSRLQSRVQ